MRMCMIMRFCVRLRVAVSSSMRVIMPVRLRMRMVMRLGVRMVMTDVGGLVVTIGETDAQ